MRIRYSLFAICRLRGVVFIFLTALIAGVGIFFVTHLRAAPLTYVYPPEKNVLVNRSFEPADFSAASHGETITVTIYVTNNEDVALRGFYYSDQVPNGWVVNTSDVSVNGSPIVDYVHSQGWADEVYTGLMPHRWALEMPQGGEVFSPTHPITPSGGTAQIAYTMIVSGGIGSDYAIGREAWAGWLTTVPTGTAVFGYRSVLSADFTAQPQSGLPPLTVQFTDLSTGDVLTRTWDFGDGITDTLESPTHTYTAAGVYTVSLTVSGLGGTDDEIKAGYITVYEPVQADFTASPTSGVAPLTVVFTNTSTGDYTAS